MKEVYKPKWNKLLKSLILVFIALQYLETCLKLDIPIIVAFKWPKKARCKRFAAKLWCVLIPELDQSKAPLVALRTNDVRVTYSLTYSSVRISTD